MTEPCEVDGDLLRTAEQEAVQAIASAIDVDAIVDALLDVAYVFRGYRDALASCNPMQARRFESWAVFLECWGHDQGAEPTNVEAWMIWIDTVRGEALSTLREAVGT